MNGTQTLIAILSIAVIIGGNWSFKRWLDTQSHIKEIEYEIKVREREAEYYRIIADLALNR